MVNPLYFGKLFMLIWNLQLKMTPEIS